MGLLDKIKNTFFEEEYVEVEEKPKKHSKKQVKINNYSDDNEEKEIDVKVIEEKKEKEEEPIIEEKIKLEEPKKRETFSYFDEDDFLDFEDEEKEVVEPKKEEKTNESYIKSYENSKKDIKKPYGGASLNTSYQGSPFPKNDQSKKFTPTPIISPIYGVLDKNYTKEEIEFKKETKPASYVSRKNADLDSVRKKAFGTSFNDDFGLTDEKDLTIKEVDLEERAIGVEEDNLLYDMTDDYKTPSVDKVTLQDAEEYFEDLGLEYNVDYKDTKLEKATGRRSSKKNIDMTIEEEPEIESNEEPIIENQDDDSDLFTEIDTFDIDDNDNNEVSEDASLEDNLFDLIDSMYEEEE